MDKATALRLAKECFNEDETTIINDVNVRSIARLWAGMGNIYHVQTCPKNEKSLIVKYVHPRLSSGNLSIGDQRKLDSYIVESNFYQYYAKRLIDDYQVPLPTPYKVECHTNNNNNNDSNDSKKKKTKTNKNNPTIIICMSPLQDPGYNVDSDDIHRGVMEWLAKFHAATWQKDIHFGDKNGSSSSGDDDDSRGAGVAGAGSGGGVQKVGTYWHLDTRPDEWDRIPRKGWEGRLKLASKAIDERLKRDPLQCWVHGDTKDANILVMPPGSGSSNSTSSTVTLSFCDFQYVGKGPPTKDLAYYLCSSGPGNERKEQQLLDLYWNALINHLKKEQQDFQKGDYELPTREQFDDSLELAYADYCRFMAGWGYWGSDLSRTVKTTLNKLDNGKPLKSEDDYREAVERVFG